MTGHRAVIEVGPGDIRRLCCGATDRVAAELVMAALDAVDDPVALVGACPADVDVLWRTVLETVSCAPRVLIVHPSWWPVSRIERIAAAARCVADEVGTLPRSRLLAGPKPAPLVVEIGPRLVAISEAAVAVARVGEPRRVAETVVERVAEIAGGPTSVLIDGPDTVDGAGELAAMISGRLGEVGTDLAVRPVDDTWLTRCAAAVSPVNADTAAPARRDRVAPARGRRARLRIAVAASVVVVTLIGPGAGVRPGHPAPAADPAATTFLVEGRVALQVPAHWPAQRITVGPGSARVQVTSPSDPQVAIHLTQTPVPGETLSAAAASLKLALERANTSEAAEVFVEFNPSGSSAGRPAVTYREVRTGHHIWWTVLLDGGVRIGIGCQGPPGGVEAVRAACEQAVRSAHALG